MGGGTQPRDSWELKVIVSNAGILGCGQLDRETLFLFVKSLLNLVFQTIVNFWWNISEKKMKWIPERFVCLMVFALALCLLTLTPRLAYKIPVDRSDILYFFSSAHSTCYMLINIFIFLKISLHLVRAIEVPQSVLMEKFKWIIYFIFNPW